MKMFSTIAFTDLEGLAKARQKKIDEINNSFFAKIKRVIARCKEDNKAFTSAISSLEQKRADNEVLISKAEKLMKP